MNTHPYLRAYMAGITVPTMLLVVAMTVFTISRYVYNVAVPIERIIVFPMAIVPNLWGLWNIVYVRLRSRRYLPIGFHGVILAFVQASLFFAVTRLVHFAVPDFVISAFPIGFPLVLIVFYLVWKHVVGFLNVLLGIE